MNYEPNEPEPEHWREHLYRERIDRVERDIAVAVAEWRRRNRSRAAIPTNQKPPTPHRG